jgi:23S rRNA pseudouridine1911/1915/1917 synthase
MNDGAVYREIVGSHAHGKALLPYLVAAYPHSDEVTWRARIAGGELSLDGATATAASPLRAGQTLCWSRPPWQEPDAPLDVTVLFEDDDVLAVHKPAGLPTLPGAGFQEHTLLAWVRARAPSASPVHRLGRGTSGLVLCVKNTESARNVQTQWQTGGVVKVYRALVHGVTPFESLVVDAPIGLVEDAVMADGLFCATPHGKRARSRLRVVERRASCTLLDVTIETGRPHQIRIHTAAAGHPLEHDPLYGIGGTRREGSTARPGDTGYLLHAHTLTLAHPRSGAVLHLEAPPPAALVASSSAFK